MKFEKIPNSVFIRIEKSSTESDSDITIHEILSGKRWIISKDQLISLVMQEDGSERALQQVLNSINLTSSSLRAAWSKWCDRGWRWSGMYYLAALRTKFVDFEPFKQEERIQALEQYAKESRFPTGVSNSVANNSIQLSYHSPTQQMSVGSLLQRRHSVSAPIKRRVDFRDFELVITGAFANVKKVRESILLDGHRSAFMSFGAAIDVYITVFDVEGIEPGIYELNLFTMKLNLVCSGDFRALMSDALIGQNGPLLGAFTISLVTDYRRQNWRYRHARALRLLWMDAARIASSVIWQATALHLEMQISPAVLDTEFLRLMGLELNYQRQCLYNLSIS